MVPGRSLLTSTAHPPIIEDMRTYSTRAQAIAREIVDPINEGAADAIDYDVDAIADAVLGDYEHGYAPVVDADEFWEIVSEHALS